MSERDTLADEEADVQLASARAAAKGARNQRWAVALAVASGLVFVTGWFVLTMDLHDGGTACGTSLSNPGWQSGRDCHSLVVSAGIWGWCLLAVSIGGLFAAARLGWGVDWSVARLRDGRADVDRQA